jgi:hypothetical protein
METQSELEEAEGGIIEDGKGNHLEDNNGEGREEEKDEDGDGDEAMLENSIFTATYSCPSPVSSYTELKKNFLSFCCRCRRPISQGRNIYMYRYKDSTLRERERVRNASC